MGQLVMTRSPKTREQGHSDHSILWNGFRLDFGRRTYIAGILNCTPDSFSDGGLYLDPDKAVSRAIEIADEGADIIDIGGESTRPGSIPVSADEEIRRVIPVIKRLKGRISIPVSIDTTKAAVAREAIENGASIVNDVTGLRGDDAMARVVAECCVPVVIMHMKGTPRTMQDRPVYKDIVSEISSFFKGSIEIARRAGVDVEKIILDPGIGFGKTLEHNLKILRSISSFRSIGRPIMIGVSRKSFLGQLIGSDVNDRLLATASSVAVAIAGGADIIRVHDVRQMREVTKVTDSICR